MALHASLLGLRPGHGAPARLFGSLVARHEAAGVVQGARAGSKRCYGSQGSTQDSARDARRYESGGLPRQGEAGPSSYSRRGNGAFSGLDGTGNSDTQRDGKRPLVVLGIESSADDSCAAVVDSTGRILSNVVRKQHDINAKFGGINPLVAQWAHERNIPVAISTALEEAGVALQDLDAIAYTRGPGMRTCLAIGAASAKALAAVSGKPLYGVHHMQAHAITCYLTEEKPPAFPFLALLVSGGHTQIILVSDLGTYKILADSTDNSVGNAFDRAAKYLRLPAEPTKGMGAVLEAYASEASATHSLATHAMTVPLTKNRDALAKAEFSFAGLPTQLEQLGHSIGFSQADPDVEHQRALARVFQTAAVAHLVQKVSLVLDSFRERSKAPTGVVISGGVGSNQYLRQEVQKMLRGHKRVRGVKAYYPPVSLCTDNAAMIAWAAIMRIQAGAKPEPYGLPLRNVWSLEQLYNDLDTDRLSSGSTQSQP